MGMIGVRLYSQRFDMGNPAALVDTITKFSHYLSHVYRNSRKYRQWKINAYAYAGSPLSMGGLL